MPIIVNFAAFQVGWFSSVIGAAQQLPWIGPTAVLFVVLLHLSRAKKPVAELSLIATCGIIGAFYDSLLVAMGWVTYPSGMFSDLMAPYWIITMWMLFATTLNVSMKWLKGRPLLASVLGLVAGPLTYVAGHKLEGIEFVNQTAALAALGIGWALLMPMLMSLAEQMDGMTARPVPQASTE